MNMLSTLVTEPNPFESFDLGAVADQLIRRFEFTSASVSREAVIKALSDEEHKETIAMMLTCCDIRAIFMHVNDRV